MLNPTFKIKVLDKEYQITPSFDIHDKIECAINTSIFEFFYQRAGLDMSFKIKELFQVYSCLIDNDLTEDDLKGWLVENRVEATNQMILFLMFLIDPKKQEDSLKKK